MSQEKKEIMKNFFMDYYNEATDGDGNPSDKLAEKYYKDYRGEFPWTQDLGTLETYRKLFKSKEIGDVAREDYFHTLTKFHRSLSSPIVEPEPEPEPEPELSPPVIRRVDDTPVIRLSPASSASASSSSSLNSDKSSSSPPIVGSELDMLKEEEKQHISQLVDMKEMGDKVKQEIKTRDMKILKYLSEQLEITLKDLKQMREGVGRAVWDELMKLSLPDLCKKARSDGIRVPESDISDISGLRAGHGWSSEEIPEVEEEMKKYGLVALISARILSSKADPDADRHELSRVRKNQKKKKKKSHKKKKSKKSKKSRKSRRRKHTKRRR